MSSEFRTSSSEPRTLADHLDVDEVRVTHGLAKSTVSIRIDNVWRETVLDFNEVRAMPNSTSFLAEVLRQLSDDARAQVNQLVASMSLERATGRQLDYIAESLGVPSRDPGVTDSQVREQALEAVGTRTPETPQHNNRFEAVVAEMVGK